MLKLSVLKLSELADHLKLSSHPVAYFLLGAVVFLVTLRYC